MVFVLIFEIEIKSRMSLILFLLWCGFLLYLFMVYECIISFKVSDCFFFYEFIIKSGVKYIELKFLDIFYVFFDCYLNVFCISYYSMYDDFLL